MFDVNIPCLPNTFAFAPNRTEFIDKAMTRLQILCKSDADDNKVHENKSVTNGLTVVSQERKDAVNLLKTLCKWIVANVPRVSYSAPPEIFKFLPIVSLNFIGLSYYMK